MGVSKKRRRKIICNGIEYIWYISQDCDSIYYILNIISKDKTTILSYPYKLKHHMLFVREVISRAGKQMDGGTGI